MTQLTSETVLLLTVLSCVGLYLFGVARTIGTYKIQMDVSDNPPRRHYYVYKALGPWPMVNWSLFPSASLDSEEEAVRWIETANRLLYAQ